MLSYVGDTRSFAQYMYVCMYVCIYIYISSSLYNQ